MMHLVLVIDIHGEVDQRGLDQLRTQLDLKKQGRLTDDWDHGFGYRRIERPSGRQTKISLLREFDGSWNLHVLDTEKVDPSATELANLRAQLMASVIAAGYRATARAKPTFGAPS
jgi:hypothetical protein